MLITALAHLMEIMLVPIVASCALTFMLASEHQTHRELFYQETSISVMLYFVFTELLTLTFTSFFIVSRYNNWFMTSWAAVILVALVITFVLDRVYRHAYPKKAWPSDDRKKTEIDHKSNLWGLELYFGMLVISLMVVVVWLD